MQEFAEDLGNFDTYEVYDKHPVWAQKGDKFTISTIDQIGKKVYCLIQCCRRFTRPHYYMSDGDVWEQVDFENDSRGNHTGFKTIMIDIRLNKADKKKIEDAIALYFASKKAMKSR